MITLQQHQCHENSYFWGSCILPLLKFLRASTKYVCRLLCSTFVHQFCMISATSPVTNSSDNGSLTSFTVAFIHCCPVSLHFPLCCVIYLAILGFFCSVCHMTLNVCRNFSHHCHHCLMNHWCVCQFLNHYHFLL